MKMNKTKIIVPTLALAMGAALAGSVSGTVAWFQYSTRAQASFIGTSAHCSEALEIQAVAKGGNAVEGNWKTELTYSDVATAYGETSAKLAPITAGAIDADDDLPTDFYANPLYQHFDLDDWDKAVAANYAQFDLLFRVKDINGAAAANTTYLAKNVYLTDLDIVSLKAKDSGGYEEDTDSDLYKAIRVHIAGANNKLFANDGVTTSASATVETSTSAMLDLNNDGKLDAPAAYDWEAATTPTAYGDAGTQIANNIGAFDFTDDSDPTIPDATAEGDGLIGATTASSVLRVTVTIWIEGWQELGTAQSGNAANAGETAHVKLWDPATYINKNFGVGFRFAVPAHTSAE